MKIGVLASHNGSTLQAIIDACETDIIFGSVTIVISNNSRSGALKRAISHKIKIVHLSGKTHPSPEKLDQAICQSLIDAKVDIVFLAGFMKKLGLETLRTFKGKILNTHPALLPNFGGLGMYGMIVHKAVIKANEKESGATIHHVDQGYDTGAIIEQIKVGIIEDETADSLCEKVMTAEKKLIVDTLRKIARGELTLSG